MTRLLLLAAACCLVLAGCTQEAPPPAPSPAALPSSAASTAPALSAPPAPLSQPAPTEARPEVPLPTAAPALVREERLPPLGSRNRFFPPAAPLTGERVWGVYLVLAPDRRDPRLVRAQEELRRTGYAAGISPLGCDRGAAAALGVPPEPSVATVAVYFSSELDAAAFTDAYAPGTVDYAQVIPGCL